MSQPISGIDKPDYLRRRGPDAVWRLPSTLNWRGRRHYSALQEPRLSPKQGQACRLNQNEFRLALGGNRGTDCSNLEPNYPRNPARHSCG